MALTPWNRQEEWYQQMINASTGNYLPSISAQDAGKVMTVESDGSWGVENVPTELPSVSGTDEGKVLTVNNSGVWGAQEPIGKKFIVTLTPTSEDYSGTMDKTVAEINAAYEAGRKIVFKVILSATDYLEGALTAVRHFGSWSYDDYIGNIVLPTEGMLVTVETLGTDDGTKQTYSTHVYSLTPAT